VVADPGVTPAYADPEWLDINGDGDATDPGEHQFPTSYVRGEPLVVSAVFHLDRPWEGGGTILVSATGPDGLSLPWTPAAVAGTEVRITAVQAQGSFPGVVRHYDEFQLTWYATVRGSEGQIEVGTSSNDVYLTLGEPQTTLYHTVVHLGSHNAQGATTESDVILDVWNNVFSTNSVQRVDGMPLWYYRQYDIQSWTTQSLLQARLTAEGVLGDGRCGAWANLMYDLLGAQGSDAQRIVGLIPDPWAISPAPEGFLIESWTFNGEGRGAAAVERAPGSELDIIVAAYPYLNVTKDLLWEDLFNDTRCGYAFRFADVTDNPGVEGKGPNPNPAAIFPDHGLVEYDTALGTVWFDPSYGRAYEGATEEARLLSFEDGNGGTPGAVAGYYIRPRYQVNVREAAIAVDLNGDGDTTDTVPSWVMLIRRNRPGLRETTVA